MKNVHPTYTSYVSPFTPEEAAELFNEGLWTIYETIEVFEKSYGLTTRDHEEIWMRFREQANAEQIIADEMMHTLLIELMYGDQPEKVMELVLGEVL